MQAPEAAIPFGPPVADAENVYRAIPPQQWLPAENRFSSAAFADEVFSVDIVSRTKSPSDTARRFPGFGLAGFNCGAARSIGFDTRDEPDELFSDNHAHAHVYSAGEKSNRKSRARQLAREFAQVVLLPGAESL